MSKKQINNATDSLKAIIHQLYIALDKCFLLEENESIYIEYYGDVTISGKEQIEVKDYSRKLTDLDHNFWNTIKNWLDNQFEPQKYNTLVLLTTQKTSLTSSLYNWNSKNLEDKIAILEQIYSEFKSRKKKSLETKKLIDFVMDECKKSTLKTVLDKCIILDNHSKGDELVKAIKEKHLKSIPPSKKQEALDSLLGFITSPDIISENWEISYHGFCSYFEELTSSLCANTIIFPAKVRIDDIVEENYEIHPFVCKIKAIDYDEVIPDAIDDYIHTNSLILNEMNNPIITKRIESYQDEINDQYKSSYRKADRASTIENRINKSQDFYDEFIGIDAKPFYNYNSTDNYFRRGLIHDMANDENKYQIKWRLKDE